MIGFIREETKEEELRYELEDGKDMFCLGEGVVLPARMEGSNNTLVIGSTRSGKSTSLLVPSVLHTYNSSLVIPIVKRKVYEQCAPVLKERGYEIIDLNLADPKKSTCGYDPMSNVRTEDEMLSLATSIMGGVSRSLQGESDPFWNEASAGTIAACMALIRYLQGKTAGFLELIDLYRQLEITYPNGHCHSNLDDEFEEMEMMLPESQAPRLWRTLIGTASRTASCIVSVTNNALSRFCGEYGKELFGKKKKVNLSALGQRKIALFITTNSVSEPCQRITNLLYADLIHQLFEEAEKNGGTLKIPVSCFFDDFAAGGAKINRFSEYISTFCAAGICAMILLQSKSQLSAIYNEYESATIVNNCDNIVFLGSNDVPTAKEIAERTGMSVREILEMKPGKEIFSRRGYPSRLINRYPTYEDPIYRSLVASEKETIK